MESEGERAEARGIIIKGVFETMLQQFYTQPARSYLEKPSEAFLGPMIIPNSKGWSLHEHPSSSSACSAVS